MEALSARVQGVVTIQLVEKRSEIVRLDVSWLTRAEKLRETKKIVGAWARGRREWWGVFVDTTALDVNAAGKVFINGDHSKHVAVFTVNVKGEVTPPPVSVMSIVSRRR